MLGRGDIQHLLRLALIPPGIVVQKKMSLDVALLRLQHIFSIRLASRNNSSSSRRYRECLHGPPFGTVVSLDQALFCLASLSWNK